MTTPAGPRLMRGATNVRWAIAAYLKEAFPKMRTKALSSWSNANPAEIPQIMVFNPFDNIVFDSNSKPILGVEVYRAQDFTLSDLSDVGAEYRPRYQVHVNVWTWSLQDAVGDSLGPQRASAIRMRDDLTALVRACILDRPTFGTGDALVMELKSLTEDYHQANPSPNTSQRYFAGAQLSFDVIADEVVLETFLNDRTKPNTFEILVEVDNLDRADGHYPNIGKLP